MTVNIGVSSAALSGTCSVPYRLIDLLGWVNSTKAYQLTTIPFTALELTKALAPSSTAVVLTEFLKEERKIRVLYAEEFEHANPQDIVDLCFNLYRKHWNTWIWVDGSNRAFVNLMKVAFNESLSWESSKTKPNPEAWKVLPVNFATEHKQMLAHLHMLVNKEYLAIPKEFDKLIISLRTAYANEYSLDKEQSSYSDSLDALRLACKMYKMN